MESLVYEFVEEAAISGYADNSYQSGSYFFAGNSITPKDEDEDDEDEDDDDVRGKDVTDDEPPVDKDVVHSPVPPQTGGKPKS